MAQSAKLENAVRLLERCSQICGIYTKEAVLNSFKTFSSIFTLVKVLLKIKKPILQDEADQVSSEQQMDRQEFP